MGDEFQERLAREAEQWQQEGLISASQREAILARGGSKGEYSAQQRKLTATIATMGAVLVGAGVILFFSSNWKWFSPAQKMATLLALLVATHGVGYWLETGVEPYPRMSRAINLLGCVLYGANIFLLAQAYNINSHWPNGVLWWGLGTLPFALLLDSKAMGALAYGLLSFWIGSELFISVDGGSAWWARLIAVLAWGCAGLGVGHVMIRGERFERPGEVFQSMGLAFVLFAVFPMTFHERYGHDAVAWATVFGSPFLQSCIFGSGGVASVSAVFLVTAGRTRLNKYLGLWLAGALGWLTCVLFLLPLGTAYSAVAGNGIYLGGILGLLFMGYIHAVASFINLGLLAFSALIIARYFDFVWSYVDRAGGFILGGLLLLLFGFAMERWRRALLRGPGTA